MVLAIAGAISSANAATEDSDDAAEQPSAAKKPSEAEAKPTSRPGTKPDAALSNRAPPDAAAALVRAAAAYEYGDLNQVVEAARFITEGSLPATQEQQAEAFRLLGIGLYLTNRPLGAEAAFTELLRKDPRARLDPTTTRPELVAFFESLRHQHLTRQRSTRKVFWNFIPPGGQFQNEDNVKGWVILGVGFVAAATTATSYALFEKWKISAGNLSTHYDAANAMKTVNIVSGAVLIAVYVYGVIDGLVGYSKPLDDSRPPVSLHFFPGGSGLGFTF
jgi:hypothetical protein